MFAKDITRRYLTIATANLVIKNGNEIFLDHASTTPIASSVAKEISKFMKLYGNPSSKHALGEKSKEIIENAREKIANHLGCSTSEIFFTSGGTESNNLVLKGICEKYPQKKHIIISEIEHPSVLETCNYLKTKGYEIDQISVSSEGIVNLNELRSKIRTDTLLVSIMHINNEIGTIQPVEEIAKICKEMGTLFHSDMVQSLGKIDINLEKIGLDFASFSGHKINALKGVGVVYIKRGIRLTPQLHGGNQEKGIRSGTENFLGIVSFASALEIKRDRENIKKIRDKLIKEILTIPGTILNGSREKRIYNNINVSFYGIEGESILMLLSKNKIYISTGSACSSNKLSESHVLKAIGVDEMYINGSIRISLDELSEEEIEKVIKILKESVKKLQDISPFKFKELDSTKSREVK